MINKIEENDTTATTARERGYGNRCRSEQKN
jgi:hypothetical protein